MQIGGLYAQVSIDFLLLVVHFHLGLIVPGLFSLKMNPRRRAWRGLCHI